MAQGDSNSTAYIVVGLVIVVAVIAYFVFGDGMAMFGGDPVAVTGDGTAPADGGTAPAEGGTAPATEGGETTAPASND